MARRPRRNHSPAFEAKVAVAAIKGEKTMIGLAHAFDIHANQIKQWRDQLLEDATAVFGDSLKADRLFAPAVLRDPPELPDLSIGVQFCPPLGVQN